MTAPTSQRFLDAVRVAEVSSSADGVRSFEAMPQYVPWPKAYGGDTAAQAVAAASLTVDDDRTAHSLHAYFLSPVEIGSPVRVDVSRTRDGRSFSMREISVWQSGKKCLSAAMSFATAPGGDHFPPPASFDVPAPDDLPSSADALEPTARDDAADYWASGRSFDMRHVESALYDRSDPARARTQSLWVRSFDALPSDVASHPAALTYVCDYTILEAALRLRGLHWRSAGLTTASLDHAMWFHRPLDVSRWFLYTQEALSVQDDRALVRGSFHQDGRLVATVAQEGLVRWNAPTTRHASEQPGSAAHEGRDQR